MNSYLTKILLVIFIFQIKTVFAAKTPNLIFISIDGVRTEEFFSRSKSYNQLIYMKNFWSTWYKKGVVFGDHFEQKNIFKVNSFTKKSLPAYQNIMLGKTNYCLNNYCSRIKKETLFETLQKNLKLKYTDIAVFSSWSKIDHAVNSGKNSFIVNTGQTPFKIPNVKKSGKLSEKIEKINQLQMIDKPEWKNARLDKYTFELAKLYIKNYLPKISWISFNDPDEWGHIGLHTGYIKSILKADSYIDELMKYLKTYETKYYENTIFVITTDHGRGLNSEWTEHGFTIKGSEKAWFYIQGPGIKSNYFANKKETYGHSDIAPTILHLFGIESKQDCRRCGKLMKNILVE